MGVDLAVVPVLEGIDEPVEVGLLEGLVDLPARLLDRLVQAQLVGLEPLEQRLGDGRGGAGLAELVQLVSVAKAGAEEPGFQQCRVRPRQPLDPAHEVRIDRLHGVVDRRRVAVLDPALEGRQAALEPFVGLAVGLLQRLVGARALEVCEDVLGHCRRLFGLAPCGEPVSVVGPCPVDGKGGSVGKRRRGAAHRGQRRGVPAAGL